MDIYTASQARENLFKLIDKTAEAHEPVCITGRRNKAILMSEEDFRAIQETLYLLSVPGMRESLLEGKKVSLKECDETLDW